MDSDESVTTKQIQEWYKLACHHKINVYYDYNDIIKRLCKIALGKIKIIEEKDEVN